MTAPFLPGLDQQLLMAQQASPEDQAAALGVPASIAAPGLDPSIPLIPPTDPLPVPDAAPEALAAPVAQPVQPKPVADPALTLAGSTTADRTTRTSTPFSARDKALEAEQDKLLKQQVELERRRIPLEQERAAIAQRQADENAVVAQKRTEAVQAVRDEIAAETAAREADDAADIERMRTLRDETFWGDDTGRKIAGALAVGLGSFAATLTGTRNSALDIINQHMARWRADREAKIEQVASEMERRTKNAQIGNQIRMQGLDLLEKQDIAAKERNLATAAASMAKVGATAAEIQSDERIIAMKKQVVDAKQARADKRAMQMQTVEDSSKEQINTAIQKSPSQVFNIGTGEQGVASEGSAEPGAIFNPETGEKIGTFGPKRAKAADEANKILAGGMGLEGELSELLGLVSKHKPSGGGTAFGRIWAKGEAWLEEVKENPGLARMKALGDGAISTLNTLRELGALSETEIGLLENQLGIRYDTREAAIAALKQTLKGVRRSMMRRLGAKGMLTKEVRAIADRLVPESLFADSPPGKQARSAKRRGPSARPAKSKLSEVRRAKINGDLAVMNQALSEGALPVRELEEIRAAKATLEAELRGE